MSKRKCYYNVASECSSEIEIKCIFIKAYDVVSVVENQNITVQRHVGVTYMGMLLFHIKKQLQLQMLMA